MQTFYLNLVLKMAKKNYNILIVSIVIILLAEIFTTRAKVLKVQNTLVGSKNISDDIYNNVERNICVSCLLAPQCTANRCSGGKVCVIVPQTCNACGYILCQPTEDVKKNEQCAICTKPPQCPACNNDEQCVRQGRTCKNCDTVQCEKRDAFMNRPAKCKKCNDPVCQKGVCDDDEICVLLDVKCNDCGGVLCLKKDEIKVEEPEAKNCRDCSRAKEPICPDCLEGQQCIYKPRNCNTCGEAYCAEIPKLNLPTLQPGCLKCSVLQPQCKDHTCKEGQICKVIPATCMDCGSVTCEFPPVISTIEKSLEMKKNDTKSLVKSNIQEKCLKCIACTKDSCASGEFCTIKEPTCNNCGSITCSKVPSNNREISSIKIQAHRSQPPEMREKSLESNKPKTSNPQSSYDKSEMSQPFEQNSENDPLYRVIRPFSPPISTFVEIDPLDISKYNHISSMSTDIASTGIPYQPAFTLEAAEENMADQMTLFQEQPQDNPIYSKIDKSAVEDPHVNEILRHLSQRNDSIVLNDDLQNPSIESISNDAGNGGF
ncbi:hypothetical protein G9A89_004914 [Geosiphon pyriformis]|nr:hypothetical protein G9A89_004914 [Geosiphon pyriformis]